MAGRRGTLCLMLKRLLLKFCLPVFSLLLTLPAPGLAAGWAVNEQGVGGYDDTPMLSWCDCRKHDANRPVPVHVEAEPVVLPAPSDAIVLFDGTNLDAWQPNQWSMENGTLVSGDDALDSVESFGDCQIHLEFQIPTEPEADLFNRGNNGVAPMGAYEIQIFDSHPMHAVQIYPDGQCAAIYGETPPLINACLKPGEWQSFDILFTAPRFQEGRVLDSARVTMLHNGVLVHLNQVIHGATAHKVATSYHPHAGKRPLTLKGHHSAVRFRNIWVRPLEIRAANDPRRK